MSEPVSKRGWIGRTLEGRYEVLGVIGEGGMGAVFRARHLLLDKEVALKVVHPGLGADDELAARFAREAAVTSRLDHPNVISVSDSGRLEDGGAFIAMPFVRGPSLTQLLEREGALHWARVASLGAQLADALSAARGHGIVHRDLKPDNVLLQELGSGRELVKVLDFGIARFARDSLAPPSMRGAKHNLTQTGLIVGTPGYMAPEQSVGEPADYRSDLYSLGVILWECLTGTRLWPGDDVPAIVEKQFTTVPASVRQATGDESMPAAMDALIAQLLSRRVEDRPRDPGTVKEILLTLAAEHAPLSTRTGTQPRIPLATPPRGLFSEPGSATVPAGILGAVPVTHDAPANDIAAPASAQAPGTSSGQAMGLADTVERPAPAPRRRRSLGLVGLFSLLALLAGVGLVWTGVVEVHATENLGKVAEDMGLELPPSLESIRLLRPAADLGVPSALEPALRELMGGETRSDRVGAARQLLAHIPVDEVDAYIRAVAQMQLAETCQAKSEVLGTIARVGDPRALPALHQLAARPRRGCGKGGGRDCLACMRADLGDVIRTLESKQMGTGRQ